MSDVVVTEAGREQWAEVFDLVSRLLARTTADLGAGVTRPSDSKAWKGGLAPTMKPRSAK
jgi:hypothetical protein